MSAMVPVDEQLIAEVMSLSEGLTASEVVDEALRKLKQIRRQREILQLRGMGWEGDLDEMRTNKPRPGWE